MKTILESKIIDLTHTLNSEIPTWNGSCGFHNEIKQDYQHENSGISFRVNQLKMHAGIGTHMDAPAHCVRNGACIHEIDVQNLIGAAFVINVREKCLNNPTYEISSEDIMDFEKKYGEVQKDSIVLFWTGWDHYWNNPEAYRNNHIFPSISKEAAQFLISKGIKGVGIDTLSPDKPQSGLFPVHEIFLSNGKYIIENVANLNQLPPVGSIVIALPIKVFEGTEAPIRMIALR